MDKSSRSGKVRLPGLFEWGQRELALFCRQRGLAYPPLTEDGEIVDATGWYESVRDATAPTQTWDDDLL